MNKHILVLSCLCFATACKKQAVFEQKDLIGNWKVVEAFRNDKKTSTINGAYFLFTADSIHSNFTGEPIGSTYTFADKKIMPNTPFPGHFVLRSFLPGKIILSSSINSQSFTFTLERGNHEIR